VTSVQFITDDDDDDADDNDDDDYDQANTNNTNNNDSLQKQTRRHPHLRRDDDVTNWIVIAHTVPVDDVYAKVGCVRGG